jgi:hypothetical protein
MAPKKYGPYNPKPQPAWMARVVVGSVLASGDGPWRVVREVTRYNGGRLRSVTFAIRRCSWTHRCYTVVHYNDLIQRGFRLVPVKPRQLRSRIDRRIDVAIHEPCTEKSMTCCDVEGVA